jgi:hypothetical protein
MRSGPSISSTAARTSSPGTRIETPPITIISSTTAHSRIVIIARHFDLGAFDAEIPVDSEIKSFEELSVGLKENGTILGVARKLAQAIVHPRNGDPGARRARLRHLLRYRESPVSHAWALANTKQRELETRFVIPRVAEAGRPVSIRGPAPGTFEGKPVRVGNAQARLLACSPRKLVFGRPLK